MILCEYFHCVILYSIALKNSYYKLITKKQGFQKYNFIIFLL